MAQTGYTPISIYYSSTAAATPTAGNLVAGELAINTADGKLFYKDSAGVVQVIGTKGGVGSSTTTQVLYNSSGLVVGSANMTFNGTTLTLANDASISGLTVGKGGGAIATNTTVGSLALSANTTGAENAAFGYYALGANTSGIRNASFGVGSLYTNTTGSNNTAHGWQALYSNTTAAANTAVGYQSGFSTTTGNLTALGYQAGFSNTTGGSNVALGHSALRSNTTASNNTAVGYQAGYSNTTASGTTAFGSLALSANTTGAENAAFGYYALGANTSGIRNASFGVGSLYTNTTGSNNTAHGWQALYSNTTAAANTAVGYHAGLAVTTGTNNTFLGFDTGNNITTGIGNTHIGYSTLASAVGANYEIVIGTGGTGKGSQTGFINPAGGGVYQGNNSAAWSITSDQRLKKNIVDNKTGLSAITAIQVRNFEYRLPEEVTEISPDQAIQKTGIQLGAIAQELQAVLPECVKQETTGVYTVNTDPLIWYLINAVKELKTEIDLLKGELK